MTNPSMGKAPLRALESFDGKARSRKRSNSTVSGRNVAVKRLQSSLRAVMCRPSAALRGLKRESPFLRPRALHTTRHIAAECGFTHAWVSNVRGDEYRREATTSQARHLRQRSTDAENLLWRHLRNRRLRGVKFRRQRAVGPYIVDFYCPEAALVIEIDGGGHLEQVEADRKRTAYLESHGVKVLRFWNDEVLQQTETVLECIAGELGVSPSPRPSPLGGEGEKRGRPCNLGEAGEKRDACRKGGVSETPASYGFSCGSGMIAC